MRKTAIIFALFYEIRPLARKLGIHFFKGIASQIILDHNNIALVRAGVGKVRAKEATERIIKDFSPELLISAGFCGGLIEELRVGDVVVSDFEDGKLFCSDRTLFTHAEKTAARRQQSNAVIVDMESEAVYSVAKKHNIPFIAIKSVSDGIRDDIIKPFFELPSFVKLFRLKKNVNLASKNLSNFLFDYINKETHYENSSGHID